MDPHKGQRLKFSMISKAAGNLDPNDENAPTALENEILSFREQMFLHADHEDKFIHPILSEKVPGGADKLTEDHRIMHRQFDDLLACLGEIKKKLKDFEKREDLFQEFYLAWSRFMSFYISHIDYEEETVMPTLWKLCTYDELVNIRGKILGDETLKMLMYNLGMMLPAVNPTDRFSILNQIRAAMPPEAFQTSLKIAEHVLSSEEWSLLKKMLKLED